MAAVIDEGNHYDWRIVQPRRQARERIQPRVRLRVEKGNRRNASQTLMLPFSYAGCGHFILVA
jgi:hypothetical protein